MTNAPATKYPLLLEIIGIKNLTLQATYSIRDVAQIFSVSVRAIQNRVASGQLPARDLSGRAKLLPLDLEMLRTTCSLLGTFLDPPGDRIPFDTIDNKRRGFRKFLEGRKYAENSIRSYVYQLRLLLKIARQFGWKPDDGANEAWKPLLVLAAETR